MYTKEINISLFLDDLNHLSVSVSRFSHCCTVPPLVGLIQQPLQVLVALSIPVRPVQCTNVTHGELVKQFQQTGSEQGRLAHTLALTLSIKVCQTSSV